MLIRVHTSMHELPLLSAEDEEEKIEGEMLIRTIPTTLLQIFFNVILYSKVFATSIEVSDVNF